MPGSSTALGAIRFAGTMMRGGEDELRKSRAQNDSWLILYTSLAQQLLCQECPEGEKEQAMWYCLQCDLHLSGLP